MPGFMKSPNALLEDGRKNWCSSTTVWKTSKAPLAANGKRSGIGIRKRPPLHSEAWSESKRAQLRPAQFSPDFSLGLGEKSLFSDPCPTQPMHCGGGVACFFSSWRLAF